ncbi:FAD-binding oxidoreductase [Actinopolymorpha pittospori]|uniref:FAD/FMN-containing dehydrogenase n=1 Tax=Actinopolymorpha pittospori TaxID=648752 RepID=A0A927MY72_9ACTN|nr:FAD-binding oxidoreductase [Actinopolymorpha pittospori]MBE1605487.1 FAD/FMN-containing dehydrogenase [Actinopolymorpha pittospori]
MSGLSRRNLFKATAAAGAGAVVLPGTAMAGSVAMDGGDPAAGYLDDAESKGAKGPRAKLTGRIVRPNDPGYEEASLGWDELFVHYPLVIVYVQETQDVVNALTWARQNNVALRVRAGGHSLEGWSNVDNGLVIDVSELKSSHIDSDRRIAKVGAGLNQGEAVAALGEQDFAATTGTEASVGLAGATLGGGFGFLTRYLGMACDSLIGAEIVVPSGVDGAKVLEVDEKHHSDLLWALRGAGNGNFGIVTSLTYKVAPLKEVAYLTATWAGLGDLQGVFDAWQSTAPYVDNRLGTQLEVHKPEILFFAVLADGTEAQARKLVEPILSVGNPEVTIQTGAWADIYAGFQVPTAVEPANWKFFSQFTRKPFPKKAISIIGEFMNDAPTDDSNFFTQAFGGAVQNKPAGGTSFPHRDALFYSEPGAGWGTRGEPDSGDALTPTAQAWIAEFSQALRPYVDGAYVNVPNIGMQEWERAYWGRNFARLRRVKAKYDPHNVFQYEQSIPPATPC